MAALSTRIDLQATASGFHTVGLLPDDADEERIVAGARERGIIVAALSRYCMTPIGRKGLVLGFGGVTPDEIRRGVKTLRTLPDLAS
jgi:GntR family transcriptional regulator/MocR family aminotransferase